MAVKLEDCSFEVKAAINETSIAWLYEWADEILSHAKRNCSTEGWTSSERADLRDHYKRHVDEVNGIAHIGNELQMAYWEEFGTGEHADTNKNGGIQGRKGWWVYKDDYQGKGGKVLTKEQAEAMAAGDPTLHATNGRDPNYTLENAFNANKRKAEADLKKKLKEMGE